MIVPLQGAPLEDESLADSVSHLLGRAAQNQYRGSYSADVIFVRDSFLRGTDSLNGQLHIDDPGGERKLRLQGRDEAFEWWSLNFGQEQWWKDDANQRLHRVPYRSFKKPAFASLLTFEDLIKFPADYLVDYKSCQNLVETDSTYELALLMKTAAQSRYGSLSVTLSKRPVLLTRVIFFGAEGRKLKSLEISSYRHTEAGYLPIGFRIFNGDSLSSLQVSLLHPMVTPSSGRDKTVVPARPFPPFTGQENQTALEPSEGAEPP